MRVGQARIHVLTVSGCVAAHASRIRTQVRAASSTALERLPLDRGDVDVVVRDDRRILIPGVGTAKVRRAFRCEVTAPNRRLLQFIWMDNTEGEALVQWRHRVRDFREEAERELACLDEIVADPPRDLVSMLNEDGWIIQIEESAKARSSGIATRSPTSALAGCIREDVLALVSM